MKKVLKLTLLTIMCLLLASTIVKATESFTAADLENYIKASFNINGYENDLRTIFDAGNFTNEQATAMKAKVDEGIALMESADASSIGSLTVDEFAKLQSIVVSAAKEGGLSVVFNDDNSVTIMKGNTTVITTGATELRNVTLKSLANEPGAITTGEKFQATGSSNIAYVLGLVAIVAGATFVVVKKVRYTSAH